MNPTRALLENRKIIPPLVLPLFPRPPPNALTLLGIYRLERFKPEAFYGNPTERQIFMVVGLETPAQIAELMYMLTWFTGDKPTFTPIMNPAIYGEAIANAKKIVGPPPSRHDVR